MSNYKGAIAVQQACLIVDCGTISSLPQTILNDKITSDMVVIQSVFGTPTFQTSPWEVSTSDGSLTISGGVLPNASSTLTLYLMNGRT